MAADLAVGLPFSDAEFDLVYSYNAFEHFPNPAHAYSEFARVCKPGGLMHFEFDPLFASPWGLHAYRSIHMPYPQFLFNMDFLTAKLAEIGINDLGRERVELQPMNRWRRDQFKALWENGAGRILTYKEYRDFSHLDMVVRFPDCFRGLGLTVDDLTVHGIVVTIERLPG